MKKLLLLFIALAIAGSMSGQLSGDYYIPTGGVQTYPTIRDAIQDLNNQGVGGTGATFHVAAGYVESITDSLVLKASGRNTGYIIFQKEGTGDNPQITRANAGVLSPTVLGGQGDAVMIFQGCDFVRFDGIDINATNSGIEYGYYFRKEDQTNGCKNVVITNCKISMTKGTSVYVTGIYVSNLSSASPVGEATGITPMSTEGIHENVTITSNTIESTGNGIMARGYNQNLPPYNLYDLNITIGGSAGAGNIIRNYGGGSTGAYYGVYTIYQNNAQVSYNTLNNAGGGGVGATGTIYGIYNITSVNAAFNASYNTLSLTTQASGSAIYGIYSTSTGNLTINQNSIEFNTINTTSGALYYIYNTGVTPLNTISYNTFVGTSVKTTGGVYFIYNYNAQLSPGASNTYSNAISGNWTKDAASGTVYGYYNISSSNTATESFYDNNFSNITCSGTSTFYGYYTSTNVGNTQNVYGNTFNNIAYGSGTSYGIYCTGAGTKNIYGNTVSNIAGASTTFYGINAGTGNTTSHIRQNNIFNLSTSSNSTSAAVYGIYISAGTNVYIYNNFVSELKAPAGSSANSISGIYIAASTNANVYYNTVYLNASSTGTNFGTSAIYCSSTSTALDLRNNILVNKSARSGTGFTTGIRRTAAYAAASYALSSNGNDILVPVTPPFNYIFWDGIAGTAGRDSSITMFKTRVAPRDGISFSEDPPFFNSTTSPFNLHLQPVVTKCESGGVSVSTPIAVTSDFDQQQRYPDPLCPNNPTYPATAPDVGADEFAGIPSFTCITPVPGNTAASDSSICLGQQVIFTMQNNQTGTGISYQWQRSLDNSVFTDISGAVLSTYTTIPDAAAWYRCVVTCQNGPSYGTSGPVLVTFNNAISSTQNGGRCGTGTVMLEATGSGERLAWYGVPSGGATLGTGTTFTTPVISSTTNYYVAGEDTSVAVVTIGAGATTSATYSNPFYSLYSNLHNQHLILASELLAAGLTAGNFTSLALNISSVGTLPMLDFSLKLGLTSATNLSSFVSPAFTTLYTSASYMPVAGVNTMIFTTPFSWDGTSNLVIEICHGNPASTATMSRTCIADNTSFVSTISTHATVSTGGSVICSDITTNKLTYSLRPQFKINGITVCSSPRSTVTATITAPPAFDITDGSTICNNTIVPLAVTTNLSSYDSYTWSPVANLFTDAGCTIAYTGENLSSVYFQSATAGTFPVTCTAMNNSTYCSSTDQLTLVNLPGNPTITASPASLCVSGTSTLSLAIPGGSGTATFQWQESSDGVNFSDISGATNLTYTTGQIGLTTYYKLIIRNGAGEICVSPQYTLTVNNPLITSTTPGFHCGPGTVTLEATGTTGQLTWYASPNGGTVLGTGTTFTTPYLNTSQTFYVSALEPGTIVESAGKMSPTGTTAGSSTPFGEVFSVSQPITLQSVDVYPTGANGGQISVSLYNSAQAVMAGPFFFNFPVGNGATAYTLPLNIQIPAGTGYRLILATITGGTLVREGSGVTYPINTSSLLSLTSAATSLTGTSTTTYNYFYNWRVISGCASPLTPVLATINVGPVYELTFPQAVCNTETAMMTVWNGSAYYDTFTWTPATNLYTDAACTIPYIADSSALTVYMKTTVPGTYQYIGHADNSENGCNNFDTTYVTILPPTVSIASDIDTICLSGIAHLSLLPSMSYGNAVIQWQSSTDNVVFSDIAGATTSTYTTDTLTTSMYYKVIISNSNYNTCLSAQIGIFVDSPSILSTTPGSRCGTGTVVLEATASEGSILRWYNAPTGGTLVGYGSPFTTPSLTATTTYYVAAEHTGVTTVSVGNGISQNTTTGYPTAYGARYESAKIQMLITAAELTGAGVQPGPLNYLTFDVASVGTSGIHKLYTIKMAHTALTAMTTTYVTSDLVTVWGPQDYQPVNGINVHTFNTPFVWDGVSNVLVEVCHSNDPSGTGGTQYTYNAVVNRTTTSFTSVSYRYTDNVDNCPQTAASYTSAIRPNIGFSGIGTRCSSLRVPVIATVNPSNPVNITPNRTICSGEIHTISVTSNPGDYDVYTWSPVENLYIDATATLPYVNGMNKTVVYFKSTTGITATYTCNAVNTVNFCNDTAKTTVTVIPVATIGSALPNICVSGSAILSLAPASGYGLATFQWMESADSLVFTDITGATTSSYTTPVITANHFYKVIIRNSNGVICSEPGYKMVVTNPTILSTTPAQRCGPGTLQLAATVSPGATLNWYTSATGGIPVATGSPFTTPVISATTSYFAGASEGFSSASVGKYGIETSAGTGGGSTTYMNFSAISDFTLFSVDVFPYGTGAGTLTVTLRDANGATLMYKTVNVVGANTTATVTRQTVLLNFPVTGGQTYRLGVGASDQSPSVPAWTGLVTNLYRDNSNFTYPYTQPGVMSITGPSTAGYYYFFYNWQVSVGCESPRQEVLASVNIPPDLFITGNKTICTGDVYPIQVTSPLVQFDTYTWSPVSNLYLDSACTQPYVALTNVPKVYVKSDTGFAQTYTCSASNASGLMCTNLATVTVTVIPDATIASNPPAICFSGTATLRLVPATGYGLATFQWQDSPDNVTFTDITGATNQTYTTPTLTQTRYYKVIIRNESGVACWSPVYTMAVETPSVVSTTPATRCGTGSVTLEATTETGNTLNWYAQSSGGSVLSTGAAYTTPPISTTTTYYVAANSPSAVGSGSVGAIDNTIGAGGTVALNYYLYFDVLGSTATINGVHIYPAAAGDVVIFIANSAGVDLTTITFSATTAMVGLKTYVPINVTLTAGTGYRIGWRSGIGMYRNTSGSAFPYTLPGIISITGHNFSGYPQYYYYFYDWSVSTGCFSARVPVVATVTPAPAITATVSPDTICGGNAVNLNVTSSNAGYSYTWMPGSLSGAMQTVHPEVTTQYTVSALDPISGCENSMSKAVVVRPTPTQVTITPSAPTIFAGDIQSLTASGGSMDRTGLIGTGTTTNTTTGMPAPMTQYYGGSKHQMLIKASELTAAGLYAGAQITSVGFDVAALGSTASGILNSFQVDMGNTALTALSSSSFVTGLTNVKPAATIQVTTGINTLILTTPYTWNGTSNIVVQTSFSNADTGNTTKYAQMRNTNVGYLSCNWYRANGATPAAILSSTTVTSSGNSRPNMVLGFNSGVSMIWSPTADLFTDAAATIPYAGESMAMVYAKPSSTITYTATATSSLTNCPRTGSVIVTVLSPCQIPTGVNVTNVAATSATVSWTEPGTPPGQGYEYEIRTSGAPGSGETGLFATGTTGAGVTTAGLSGLTPGTQYHVYVRSNCGDNVYSLWTSDVSFTTPYLPLAVTGVVTDNTCAYSCDGSIVTTVTGGLAPYTYLWSHGSTDASPTSLCGGIFTVTVTDAAMSTITETWTVVEPAELVLTGTVTNATCPGSVNGAINLSVTGGTSPYQYLWSTGAVTPNISGLAPGTYEVTVTDSHSCTNTGNWTVGMSNPICDNITVSGVDSTTKCYNAINTIVVAGTPNTYTVTAAGDVSFIAGLKISFMPGTKVLLGGYMHARIYSNEWCTATKLTEVASQPEEPMPSTDRAKFTLYPNPTNGNFVLMQKGEHPYGHMRVEIFNMNGEKILTEENVGIKQEFRFEMMPSGLYFVKIIAEDYTETIKLVKVK